ncbi:MAG TPA: hypothetical protein VE196_14460 [Pseudonocardiaceae bacterium]|jgi:hypothetical protein|nr:hypothetical protein [Pseudonocardiaceae bacterium]
MPDGRILATQQARDAAKQLLALTAAVKDRVGKVVQQGRILADPQRWDGGVAGKWRNDWSQDASQLNQTAAKLEELEHRAHQVVEDIFKADNGALGADTSIGAAPVGPATGRSCAATLACTIDDFNGMSIGERRAFAAEFQRLYGMQFYSSGKWNNVDGVLQFFRDDGLGKPGSWVSWVDSSILDGFERGAALALHRPGGDQGNPGADRWYLYFSTMEHTRGNVAKEDADRLWSEGEQTSTEHGYAVAAGHGASPGLPELSFAGGGEVYRWILRHEGQINSDIPWPIGREALRDFTDPANRYPSYIGGHIMHGGGQTLNGGWEFGSGLILHDPRRAVQGVVDTAEGGAEVIDYGGKAVARSAVWLSKHL